MKLISNILILFFLAILQTTLVPRLDIFGVLPDLVFILIVFWSVSKSFKEAVILGFFAGLFLDLFSISVFGFNVISLILISAIFNFTSGNILGKNNLSTFALFGFFGTIIYRVLTDFIYFFSATIEFKYNFINFILPEAAYNTVLILLIFILMERLDYSRNAVS